MINIENLNTNNDITNIWMFHRIKISNIIVSDIYEKRGMSHTIDELFCLIDRALNEGCTFGSISEAIKCDKIIHLTFDDGYKEHLLVAKALKKRYSFSHNAVTFSINIRNSFYDDKLCMDMVYQLIDNSALDNLYTALKRPLNSLDLKGIKDILFSSTKQIEEINKYVNMKDYFLNKEELISLSKLFSIGSHCVNHCYLTSLSNENIYKELKESKEYLTYVLDTEISTICFPDGKHSTYINDLSKKAGYTFGLSISPKSTEDSNFNLKRSIPRCT